MRGTFWRFLDELTLANILTDKIILKNSYRYLVYNHFYNFT